MQKIEEKCKKDENFKLKTKINTRWKIGIPSLESPAAWTEATEKATEKRKKSKGSKLQTGSMNTPMKPEGWNEHER